MVNLRMYTYTGKQATPEEISADDTGENKRKGWRKKKNKDRKKENKWKTIAKRVKYMQSVQKKDKQFAWIGKKIQANCDGGGGIIFGEGEKANIKFSDQSTFSHPC